MAPLISSTLVGVFQNREQAAEAVKALRQAGFRPDQIGMVARGEPMADSAPDVPDAGTVAAEAGVAVAVTGGALGGLLGAVAAGLIPGVGPVIAAGILAATVGGAAAGAVTGGLLGALVGLGVPEDEARYYQSEFESGRTVVTVKADERHDEAIDILRVHGAYGRGSPLI